MSTSNSSQAAKPKTVAQPQKKVRLSRALAVVLTMTCSVRNLCKALRILIQQSSMAICPATRFSRPLSPSSPSRRRHRSARRLTTRCPRRPSAALRATRCRRVRIAQHWRRAGLDCVSAAVIRTRRNGERFGSWGVLRLYLYSVCLIRVPRHRARRAVWTYFCNKLAPRSATGANLSWLPTAMYPDIHLVFLSASCSFIR